MDHQRMSTSPNKPKRARKADNSDITTTTMPRSSTTDGENIFPDSGGSKWKQRLNSLRRSLTRKRVTNFKEPQWTDENNCPQECSLGYEVGDTVVADIRFDNGSQSSGCQQNYDKNMSSSSTTASFSNCSSKDVPILNHPIANDNKANKKRKGFSRRTKDGTVRGNKDHGPSQQDLRNGEAEPVSILEKQDSDVKRRRNRFGRGKNKSLSIFPSWFRTLGRSSAGKNFKHNRRGLSVSTGNFNEREHSFKLLTDVHLLRDPGYVSSSADSLDRDDLYVEKYHSLRRSRASLIDIRWNKHGESRANLASTTSNPPRTKSKSPPLQSSSRGPSSPIVTEFPHTKELLLRNSNCNNDTGVLKRNSSKWRRSYPESTCKCENSVLECTRKEKFAEETSLDSACENNEPMKNEVESLQDDGIKLDSGGNLTEDEDVYLTAEEDSSHRSTSDLCDDSGAEVKILELRESDRCDESKNKLLLDSGSEEKAVNLSKENSPSLSPSNMHLADTNGNIKQLVPSKEQRPLQGKESVNNLAPRLSKLPKSLSQSQPLRILPACPDDLLDSQLGAKNSADACKNCQAHTGVIIKNLQRNSRKLSQGQLNELHDRPPSFIKCSHCKSLTNVLSPTDVCHDVVFTRPPKKPAPKPPSLMRNKSKSLTTLSGKFPVLSEQLDLNETSSVHKLNDSCSENLCELLSQSKDSSQSSEGVYVGIMGDQGVILRKRRVLPKPKRVLSMPSELLENVMEVEGPSETANMLSTNGNISETSIDHTFALQSSGSDVYLSCNSSTASPVVVEKDVCIRSVSISSIDVQELSLKKKLHSQSVPCLAFNKECLDGLKLSQDNHSIMENIEYSSENFLIDGHKDCISRKSSTAQSMMSLNHRNSFEDNGDTNEKVTGKPLMYAEALWDHVTMNEEELCFTAGQAIAVYDVDDPEWWFGLADDHIGWFPASFVRIPVSGDLLNKFGKKLIDSDGENQLYRSENGRSVCLSKEEIRTKIVEEIVSTEQDYVQNLKDIVEGYLKQAKRRPDMFSETLLATLFSNIESIYHFHLEFLRCIQNQSDQTSCVGEAFVKNREKFALYSEYCNNHPRASIELKNLLQQDHYRYFFEACRLLQDMIKISLDGFLLTPVQKICKYPLQLQELLKYTDPEHNDYENVKNALEAMREVASSINETKRRVENIKKIAEWQLGIEQWEGEDVLLKSSQLVHSGEVMKVSKGKTQDVTLFLFDHQLIYCRKDLIKKRSLEYKGRMVLENCKFEKLEDGEVSQNGIAVKNAWRLSNKQSNTNCLFQAKTLEQREKWIRYFLQERKIVYETTSANSIPLEERLAAMDASKNLLKSRNKMMKGEKRYGNFNTISRAIGQLHYGVQDQRQKINLPPPVSSAMLFQRNEARSSFGLLRNSGVFKKKRTKAVRQSQAI